MTAFENIVNAIREFGFPYKPDSYEGPSDHYFIYNYADERGELYRDDGPDHVVASVQVHFFLPINENYLGIKGRIRAALFEHGFTFPEVTSKIDNKSRHIIFECDIEEDMEE